MRKMTTTKSMRTRILFLSAALLAVVTAAADAQCPAAPPEALQLRLQMDCGLQAPSDAARGALGLTGGTGEALQKDVAAVKEEVGLISETVIGAIKEEMEGLKAESRIMKENMESVQEVLKEVKEMVARALQGPPTHSPVTSATFISAPDAPPPTADPVASTSTAPTTTSRSVWKFWSR